MQVVDLKGANDPGEQQVPAPAGEFWPAAHEEQLAAKSGAYAPSAHVTQGSVPDEAVPAVHEVQDVAPGIAYEPGEQHIPAPGGEYVSSGHVRHLLPREYVPDEHSLHESVELEQYSPASQEPYIAPQSCAEAEAAANTISATRNASIVARCRRGAEAEHRARRVRQRHGSMCYRRGTKRVR